MNAVTFFPEGPPISNTEVYVPISYPPGGDPMHGPPNAQLFQAAPDPPRQSDEQGIGRAPGQRWPHMPHPEPFNLESLANQGWHPIVDVPPERYGWSIPTYFGEYPDQHFTWPGPATIAQTPSRSYTGIVMIGGE